MGEVFSGFVAGYALALLSTPLVALTLLRLRGSSPLMARLFPADVPVVPFGMVLHGVLFFFWTGLGILLGLLLLAMEDEAGALGSLNGPFTLFVAGLTLALVAPIAVGIRPLRRVALACAVCVLVVFGWLMPYMAEWSRFDRAPVEEAPKPAQPLPWTA